VKIFQFLPDYVFDGQKNMIFFPEKIKIKTVSPKTRQNCQRIVITTTGRSLEPVPLLRPEPAAADSFRDDLEQQLPPAAAAAVHHRTAVRHPTQLHGTQRLRGRHLDPTAGPVLQPGVQFDKFLDKSFIMNIINYVIQKQYI
jgi:hypothetical protein